MLQRLVVLVGALALVGVVALLPAAASPPCWKRVINDWFDGRIDGRYSCACYRTAAEKLATSKDYSEGIDEFRRRARACRRKGRCQVTDVRSEPLYKPMPSFNYGNDRIRVALVPEDGRLVAGRLAGGGTRATINPDGSIDAKFGWWRAGSGKIKIEGRRLDAPAPPLVAHVPDGYSAGFQATGLTFPTVGCWQVTGRYAGAKLTFTVLVSKSALGP